jgi:hypothetical protein
MIEGDDDQLEICDSNESSDERECHNHIDKRFKVAEMIDLNLKSNLKA